MKRHRTDGVSLVFGLLFAGVAAWWLIGRPEHLGETAGWIGIGALTVIGVVGVLSAVFRRPSEPEPEAEPESKAEPGPAVVGEP